MLCISDLMLLSHVLEDSVHQSQISLLVYLSSELMERLNSIASTVSRCGYFLFLLNRSVKSVVSVSELMIGVLDCQAIV
jgi:hypothetical protein